jgi:hypothetical protein
MVWKPTYDPATYGTQALMRTVKDADRPKRDAIAAAKELAKRTLTERDGRALLAILQSTASHKVQVAILETMKAQRMTYLKADLKAYQSQLNHADSAAAGAATIAALMDSEVETLKFMQTLLVRSKFSNVRARAARLLASYEGEAEAVFNMVLVREPSASTATIICKTLGDYGGSSSLPVLREVANAVDRVFTAEKHLGEKATSETVRAAAVSAIEAIRRRTGR